MLPGGRSKKLTAAACHWARGGKSASTDAAEWIEVLRGMEGAEAAIREYERQGASAEFGVYPENWPAVALFVRLGTQWRRVNGRITGLDYAGVESALRMTRTEDADGRLFEQLQSMEFAAVQEVWRLADGN